MLLEYAFAPLTERCIEAAHAVIERFGGLGPSCHPPYIVARLRGCQIMELLLSVTAFYDCVVKSWYSPRVLVRRPLTASLSGCHIEDEPTGEVQNDLPVHPESPHEDLSIAVGPRNAHLTLALRSVAVAACPTTLGCMHQVHQGFCRGGSRTLYHFLLSFRVVLTVSTIIPHVPTSPRRFLPSLLMSWVAP